ncbi:MAG: hypothetical protein ACR2NR_19560 [Solirubrobacteraceae bacterium]
MTVYALTGGTLIVAGVVIVTLLAVIYGTFTYRGSGISPSAGDQTGDAPGSADPSDPAGEGRTNDGGAFSTHGTK